MKKALVVLLFLIAAPAVVLILEKASAKGSLGPAAMFVVIVLGVLFLFVLVTLLLWETRHREMVARLWLIALSTAAAYLVVDLVAGYLLIRPLSPPLVPDEYRHHKLVAGTHSYFEQRDFSYYQRVNNAGLRGRDITIKKAADRYRIVMLGDSFTMGKGVEDDQTFSALLEEMFRQQQVRFDRKTVEVLNAGVDSYAPILSYVQLVRDLPPLEADLVVLNLDVSDLVQESIYRKHASYGPQGEVIGVRGEPRAATLAERVRAWTEAHLFLTRLMLYHVNRLLEYRDFSVRTMVTQVNLELAKHTLNDDTEPREEQWRNLFDSILRIRQHCDANSIRFLLTVYPWGHQVNEREWVPGRYVAIPKNATISDRSIHRVLDFGASNGIQVLNLFPLFRSYTGAAPLYFNYDSHMTKEGHKLMAAGMAQYLQEAYRRP